MTDESNKEIGEFIDCLVVAINQGMGKSNAPAVETGELITGLRSNRTPNSLNPEGGMPALDHLPIAIRNARSGPLRIRYLAECFEKIADTLPWYQREEPALPKFMRGHANAFIIGPNGLEERDGVVIGASLLAPEIEYPHHNHPANELYVVMSTGNWRQDNNPWHTPGIGGLVYNSSNIGHSMRSGSKPLFAIWCLWL
ncbi:MAG: hypothetical protein CFH06_02026 [Alphaproteobacteria bacterium MarineAlpha3_Bin5]|nr:MAG: hypothetical protein CFH06_02026 [Alphaproteobacteria bacterium MarineAlpha3_Bin5]